MIRIVPGVRPNCSASRRSRNRGFSLIEVMMTVVLLAVSFVLAIPSFRDMVEKRQVTNGAEQLASFINTAQGVSMKTNQQVTVKWFRTADNEWCIGAIDRGDANPCDCRLTNFDDADFCKIDGRAYVLDNSNAGDLDLVHSIEGAEDDDYTFDPIRGLFTDLSESLTMELRSQSEDFRLNLMVNNTGRVTLCSGEADYSVPGYAICPSSDDETTRIELGPPIEAGIGLPGYPVEES